MYINMKNSDQKTQYTSMTDPYRLQAGAGSAADCSTSMEGAAEAVPPQRLQELDAAGKENSSTETQSLIGTRLVTCRQEVEALSLLLSTL